jgi:hypothetical protein
MTIFGKWGTHMLAGGYSPVPLRAGGKRPLTDKWDHLRKEPMTPAAIATLANRHPNLGLGVAGGYLDLVPVDVDTEDLAIIAAARAVLPPMAVAKKGNRGFTVFYRGKVRARRFKTVEKKPLVEVLVTGQTVLPPTIHPDTRLPYRWLTKATLFNTPVEQLPTLTEGQLQLLEQGLEPWLPKRTEYAPPKATDAPVSTTRMQSYARVVLAAKARDLAELMNGGRNEFLFYATCCTGRYVHHKILAQAELETALLGACERNGLTKDDGLHQCQATIRSGLEKSRNDTLPVLFNRNRGLRDAAVLSGVPVPGNQVRSHVRR